MRETTHQMHVRGMAELAHDLIWDCYPHVDSQNQTRPAQQTIDLCCAALNLANMGLLRTEYDNEANQ